MPNKEANQGPSPLQDLLKSSGSTTLHLPTPEETPPPERNTELREYPREMPESEIEPLGRVETEIEQPQQSERALQLRSTGISSARRHDEISANFDESNIMESRTRPQKAPKPRREAYLTDLQNVDELSGYYTAFLTGTRLEKDIMKQHRNDLRLPPKS